MKSRQPPAARRQSSARHYAGIAAARCAAAQVTRRVRALATGDWRLAAIGAAATLVAACADLAWHKDGAGPEALERDLVECRAEARFRAGPGLPFGDLPRVVGLDAVGRPIMASPGRADSDRFLLEHDLARHCMQGKGYELVPAKR